ncbi:glutamine amidotransferase [Corynebacterium sp. HMSC064E07]|uniref:type 1 glutamine amidotransferase n=1 Tax=Corynebacterium sp. HMSC064E07 TaxID=1739545 RepID=UPI0008A5E126|nr:glutamine amidotransferase [Corynebacterium sp. HMSC064E07]OFO27300.1 glutamine amidotransferase [Corynebacterium sp. HMSC064E07]
MSELSIGLILPDVLGTYGDDGNALVLRQRARMRGIDAEIVPIKLGDAVPTDLDIYTVGGGEDVAQTIAVEHLINDGGIKKAAEAGKQILAICAGFQIFGNSFRAGGRDVAGLGLVDCTTDSLESRAIGEICTLVDPTNGLLDDVDASPLTGFENHMGRTTLGADAKPLGRVVRGVGNSSPEVEQADSGIAPGVDVAALNPAGGVEGAVQGSIICTYLHGPVLARNPQLADLMLARATDQDLSSLAPLDLEVVDKLREERILSKPRPKSER